MRDSETPSPSGGGPARPDDDAPLVTPLFVLITLGALCYFVSIGSLLPVLPRYVENQLSGSDLEVGLVVGAFAVSAALVRPLSGRLGDRYGRRTMSVAGGLLAAASAFPLGLVDAVWWLVVLRLLTGLGEAAFFIGAATAAQDLAPAHRRGEAASFFSIAIYGGLAFGPVIGEFVYQDHGPGWNWVLCGVLFLGSAAITSAIPSAMGRNPNPPPRRGLLHPAALLPGSVLLLGLFAFSGYAAFVALYAEDIGIADAGPFFLAYGLIVLVVRLVGARLPDRLGAVKSSTMALLLIAFGVGVIAVTGDRTGLWVGTVALAVGMSLLFPALFSEAVNAAPDDERSHAVGTFSLFFDLSQGVGAPILGVIVSLSGDRRAAFAAGAVFALSGVALANTMLRTRIAERHDERVVSGPARPGSPPPTSPR